MTIEGTRPPAHLPVPPPVTGGDLESRAAAAVVRLQDQRDVLEDAAASSRQAARQARHEARRQTEQAARLQRIAGWVNAGVQTGAVASRSAAAVTGSDPGAGRLSSILTAASDGVQAAGTAADALFAHGIDRATQAGRIADDQAQILGDAADRSARDVDRVEARIERLVARLDRVSTLQADARAAALRG